MKKRLFAGLLAICLLLSAAPMALAEGLAYEDVKEGSPWYEAVAFVTEQGLMNGTGPAMFEPDGPVKRGMIVTVLHRLEGEPESTGTADFSDVADGLWYSESVAWGAENGLVEGQSDGSYGPTQTLLREQAAAVLFRYAQWKGLDTQAHALTVDTGAVSAYAKEAMNWCVGMGILAKGEPKGAASRGELAAAVHALYQLSEAAPEECRVRFHLNYKGAESAATVTVSNGQRVKAPATPEREDFKFRGWYTKAVGGSRYDFSQPVEGHVELYARWTYAPVHLHQWGAWTGNGNGTHSARCDCTQTSTRPCSYITVNGETRCSVCGDVASHVYVYRFNTSGSIREHLKVCVDCGEVAGKSPCQMEESANDGVNVTYTCALCGHSYTALLPSVSLPDEDLGLGSGGEANPVVEISTVGQLIHAMEQLSSAQPGDVTLTLAADMEFALDAHSWTPTVLPDNVNLTIEGNGATISGLSQPLFGDNTSNATLTVRDLTINNSAIVSSNQTGSGAFVEMADQMDTTLENCQLLNSSVSGSRTGGLVGWTCGGSNSQPDTVVAMSNCSVIGCEITGSSVGGFVGHAGANNKVITAMEGCRLENTTLHSTDDGGWRVGAMVGTANAGHVTITDCHYTDDVVMVQDGKDSEYKLYGRFVPNGTGTLTIDGVAIS